MKKVSILKMFVAAAMVVIAAALLSSCSKATITPRCGTITEKIDRGGALLFRVKFDDGTEALRDYTQQGQYFYNSNVGQKDCE